MIWLAVIRIITRVLLGLVGACFIVSMCLYKKHSIFKNLFEFTGCFVIIYGIMHMLMFAIIG